MARRVESCNRPVVGYINPANVGRPGQLHLNKQIRHGYYKMGEELISVVG